MTVLSRVLGIATAGSAAPESVPTDLHGNAGPGPSSRELHHSRAVAPGCAAPGAAALPGAGR